MRAVFFASLCFHGEVNCIGCRYNFLLQMFVTLTQFEASRKWFSGIRYWTCTDWVVIDYFTLSVYTARTNTRIHTTLVATSLVERAFSAYGALRPTRRRSPDIVRGA